jgi:hypothetical protein
MIQTLRCVALIALLAQAASASAQETRPIGLEGKFSTRHITTPQNSLSLILGPGQTPLLGQRYGGFAPDGGFAYRHDGAGSPGGLQDQAWALAGVAFGLWDNIEAGAMFLSFRLTPDFSYYDFPVFITYSWTFANVDIAARLSFLTPVSSGDFALNPGIPVLVRLGDARIDTGVFVPVLFHDPTTVGLTVPARMLYNVTAKLFLALNTGFTEPNFDARHDLSMPLGALVGYSMLVGARVLDITASFQWDRFLLLDPPSGTGRLDTAFWSVLLGVTMNAMVK